MADERVVDCPGTLSVRIGQALCYDDRVTQERWVSATEAARLLGCSSRTLRRYTANGTLPDTRAESGRRIFRLDDIQALRHPRTPTAGRTGVVTYARVSSRRQQAEGDLDRQQERLNAAAGAHLTASHHDVASGLSDKRPGLRKALTACTDPHVGTLLVTHRDRLARFGTRVIEHQLALTGVNVLYLDDDTTNTTSEAEMVEDLVAIVTSFAGRLYGQRSKKARALRGALDTHLADNETGATS